MPRRSDKRDAAREAYLSRRRDGEEVNLQRLAEELGVKYDISEKAMSYTRYNADDLTIELVGEKEVAKALGSIPQKAPLVIRNAVNETAKDARKVMIQEAKKRYALNSKGRRHLNDLQIRQKARVSDLGAELHIGGPSQKKQMRNDLGYFKTVPNRPYMGVDVANAPAVFRGKVLKNGSMKKLTGQGNLSKGFLVKFTNSTTADANHIGMVQRIVGSSGGPEKTRTGARRWRNAQGNVEQIVTMGSPSAAAMHHVIWQQVEPDVQDTLEKKLEESIQKTLARAAKGAKK